MGMTEPLVVGVDGGNSKTDVALATPDGRTLAMVRGPGSSPDKLGDESAAQVITDLVEAVRQEANAAAAPIGRLSAFLAGLDLPEDVPRFSAVLTRRWPEADVHVDNDAMAALLAGTGGTAGVAVVCGAGINAVGLGAAGQRASFRSLGALSGDWGGGLGLGRTVLWHAARAEDGRGPRTRLAELTKQHFDVHSIDEVVMALHTGKLAETRLAELVDELFRADDEADPVAVSVVGRLAEEIAAMTRVMLDRTQLRGTGARVVLAGGVLTGGRDRLDKLIDEALYRVDPTSSLVRLDVPPVAGALAHALPEGLPDRERSRIKEMSQDARRYPAAAEGVVT